MIVVSTTSAINRELEDTLRTARASDGLSCVHCFCLVEVWKWESNLIAEGKIGRLLEVETRNNGHIKKWGDLNLLCITVSNVGKHANYFYLFTNGEPGSFITSTVVVVPHRITSPSAKLLLLSETTLLV